MSVCLSVVIAQAAWAHLESGEHGEVDLGVQVVHDVLALLGLAAYTLQL